MEILKILEESGDNLYIEDLDFFETELATGGHYDAVYQAKCRKKIKQLRAWLNGDIPVPDIVDESEKTVGDDQKVTEAEAIVKTSKVNTTADKPRNPTLIMGLYGLAPEENNPLMQTPLERITHDIENLRNGSSYKSSFKKYVTEDSDMDSVFVDEHYSFFSAWEINAIISVKQMSEEFLEKYFEALDKDKIARYQQFSEEFFIKHFLQLDTRIVLGQGKNSWRKKQNRSRHLDVFLRLKGVKI